MHTVTALINALDDAAAFTDRFEKFGHFEPFNYTQRTIPTSSETGMYKVESEVSHTKV